MFSRSSLFMQNYAGRFPAELLSFLFARERKETKRNKGKERGKTAVCLRQTWQLNKNRKQRSKNIRRPPLTRAALWGADLCAWNDWQTWSKASHSYANIYLLTAIRSPFTVRHILWQIKCSCAVNGRRLSSLWDTKVKHVASCVNRWIQKWKEISCAAAFLPV